MAELIPSFRSRQAIEYTVNAGGSNNSVNNLLWPSIGVVYGNKGSVDVLPSWDYINIPNETVTGTLSEAELGNNVACILPEGLDGNIVFAENDGRVSVKWLNRRIK